LAFASALESIKAGTDIALVVGAEVQTTVSSRQGAEFLARAAHFARQRSIDDFTFPCLFARRTKACLEQGNLKPEDLAQLSAKAYSNANKNPLAHMHYVKLSAAAALQESDKNPCFLNNTDFKPFLKVSDCSQVSDGGAALVLVSEAGLARLGKKPQDAVEVLSVGHATGNLFEDSNPLEMQTTRHAAEVAFAQAGLTPKQMDVAEVHDCFTVTELLMYEALGLAEIGKGVNLLREGVTSLGGRLPVNTGGGLVGFGHPVGATGVKQILEVYRQMKGLCGDYQLTKVPSFGVCANMGGDDKTAVVTVLKNL
jgi:acetyl-CoA acyltransferase